MQEKARKLIFGLGPGRCGTSSLAWLLNEQKGALVTHEMFPLVPWLTEDHTAIQYRWEQIHHQSHAYDYVGDVSTSYLPWIDFLMDSWKAIPHLSDGFDFKFIVMQRDIEEIVVSFLLKLKRQNNNPFQTSQGNGVVQNEWDECFPKYNNVSLEEAVRKYCTDYYLQAQRLVDEYPTAVKIHDIEALNTHAGVSELLNFAGIENPRILLGIKKNTS